MRVGTSPLFTIGDMVNIDKLYKIIVYAGDNEEYFTFTTLECTKESDSYLEYITRREERSLKLSFQITRTPR